jgi:oligopeptide/dipeptide ABC transporter ATP-binding protein
VSPIAEVRSLAVEFPRGGAGWVRVVDGVSLAVEEGETLGVVGESGCGKTLTALALLRLVPEPGRIVAGDIRLDGEDVLAAPGSRLLELRGGMVGTVFQEPSQALNPVRSIGYQVTEAARLHLGLRGDELRALAEDLLAEVGLDEPRRLARSYPHQLSGGQRQRVLLASALAGDPRLLLADEPTSALDTRSQRHLVELFRGLCERRRLALVFISHDLSLVARLAARVTVLYAGETVEVGDVDEIFLRPLHPYTQALLEAQRPVQGEEGPFATIAGSMPRAGAWAGGCRFAPRCPLAFDRCRFGRPALAVVGEGRRVRCFLVSEAEESDG